MVIELLERWGSAAWRREIDAWIRDGVGSTGAVVTGPPRVVHVRFWSVVLSVPTDRGTVWFKECNPGQGFEPRLLTVLAELEPDHFPRPIAVDESTARVLLPDLGEDRRRTGVDDWTTTMAQLASVQRRLSAHRDRLDDAGLPAMDPHDVVTYVAALVQRLAALPQSHAQHLGRCQAREIDSRLDLVAEWAGRLATSGIPGSFQHHDASPSNTFGAPGATPRWIDVGDAFWTHPFAVLQVPIAMVTNTWPWGPDWDDDRARRMVDAYVAQWRQHGSSQTLRDLLEPARRLAILQRAESWRRLLDLGGDLPDDVSLPILRDHLIAATGERRH